MKHVGHLIQTVAEKDKVTVLLRGETGSGKGLVARRIHTTSSRGGNPFVEINCTAIPEQLIEAELFGHEKGAFTDAHQRRKGIFEMAHGGSLFLDEIGYLPADMQVKLLNAIEEKRIRRIGGETDINVDCRIIAGTSVDLESEMEKGTFRPDLYYRLNVFPVWLPPLRDRSADVLLLADYFNELYSREYDTACRPFHPDAVDFMKSYQWPGNIRELRHAVERAVILDAAPEIRVVDLIPVRHPSEIRTRVDTRNDEIRVHIPATGKSLEDIQREIIQGVLSMTGGNRSETARRLDISRSRLLRKIRPK